ncbi:putative SPX and EXS domain-containing protein 1-like [Capsicum annuum]|nr:putative SPX and EXS domain-containing protein 1-like [Capsicum annuum]KAF3685772.1 putative SPX and EXS domain-containing protein 1-like [Capsicum annuum]
MASSGKASAENFNSYFSLFLVLFLHTTKYNLEARSVEEHDQEGLSNELCDEIYVVGEGETLQTISDKCEDIFILEENTHINDADDVYPGLVLKSTSRKLQLMFN